MNLTKALFFANMSLSDSLIKHSMSLETARSEQGKDFKFPKGPEAKSADANAKDTANAVAGKSADQLMNDFMDSSPEGQLFAKLIGDTGGVEGAEATLMKAGATKEQAENAVGKSNLMELPADVFANLQAELSGKSAKVEKSGSKEITGGIYGN